MKIARAPDRRAAPADALHSYLLNVDILKHGAWVDSCPREMLASAKIVYPESAGFVFVNRNTVEGK